MAVTIQTSKAVACRVLCGIASVLTVGTTVLLLQSCSISNSSAGKEVVDTVEYPTVNLSADGLLSYKGNPMSDTELTDLVKKEVEQGYVAKNTSHDYGVIIIDADDRVSHGRVREVKRIIMNAGGRPGDRRK